jgi:exodeoxyribonuclease-5
MQFSPSQDNALKEVDHWFKHESKKKQTFTLCGWAGTGKTTLAKYFAENINGTVKYACYTGKAAHVMASKGCVGASTIHKLIYLPKIAGKSQLRKLEKELEELKASPEPDWNAIHLIDEALEKEKEHAGKMHFSLNVNSDLRHANLLIIDEHSMVDSTIGKDLESFGIPILALGDPEQLPPIYGAGYFTNQPPDIMLTDIHRQALDNPIIAMSKLVREGKPLPLGCYGNSKVVNTKLEDSEVLAHDIILTGLRKTKRGCDNKARQIKGITSSLPVAGDKVMCVKNNHELGLLNGQIWTAISDAVPLGDSTLSLHLKELDTGLEIAVVATEKLFLGQTIDRWDHDPDVQEFEYAYAITVHKSQGSQWDSVLLFDQKDHFRMYSEVDKRRWLYTGITRAAERVTVMRL